LLVDRSKCGPEQFSRRERKLVSLAWRARLPGTAAVQTLPCPPCAPPLLVDEVRHASFDGARPSIVGRDQTSDRGHDEGNLFVVQEQIGGRLRGGGGRSR